MLFLANENFPLSSVYLLRRAGHQIESVSEEKPGMKDVDVLRWAVGDKSIILTFDRDYGELIFKYPKLIPQGLVHFRFDPSTPEEPAVILLMVIKQKEISLIKHYTVIEEDRVRQRSLGPWR